MKLLKFLLMWAESTWFGLLNLHRYCPEWDKALGSLLDKHGKQIQIGKYTASLNGVEVWIGNPLYSFGHIHESGIKERRPSLWNMYRLWLAVETYQEGATKLAHEEYLRKMREFTNG